MTGAPVPGRAATAAQPSQQEAVSGKAGIPSAMEILCALANARYALEYWVREVRVYAALEQWIEGPRRRSYREIETLRELEAQLRAQGIEARSGETGTGSTGGKSPVGTADAPESRQP